MKILLGKISQRVCTWEVQLACQNAKTVERELQNEKVLCLSCGKTSEHEISTGSHAKVSQQHFPQQRHSGATERKTYTGVDRLRRFYWKSGTALVLAIMMQGFLGTSFPAHRTILLA